MRYVSYIGGKHHPTPQQKKLLKQQKQKEQQEQLQSELRMMVIEYLNDENDLDYDDILFIRNNIDRIEFFQDINYPEVYFTEISTPQISFTIVIEEKEIIIDKVYVD